MPFVKRVYDAQGTMQEYGQGDAEHCCMTCKHCRRTKMVTPDGNVQGVLSCTFEEDEFGQDVDVTRYVTRPHAVCLMWEAGVTTHAETTDKSVNERDIIVGLAALVAALLAGVALGHLF